MGEWKGNDERVAAALRDCRVAEDIIQKFSEEEIDWDT